LYVLHVFFVICVCFSKCFLTRKRGRGSAAGAAEDHTSIQHSLETIALQPFSFKRASRSFANTGLFSMVFRCVFSGRFWKGLFLVFLWFREVLRVPREVILATFLDKIKIFCEKLGPSFLHTLTAFWLDFQGPGPPGESKKREKTASEN
jgi:hypothetical protein